MGLEFQVYPQIKQIITCFRRCTDDTNKPCLQNHDNKPLLTIKNK